MALEGKVAIVTGGNSGIGKAVTLALARRKANIVIDYVAQEHATEELEHEIEGLGDQATGVKADVSKVEDLKRLIDRAVKSFGRLDAWSTTPASRRAPPCSRQPRSNTTKFSRSTSRARSSGPSWRPSR